MSDSREDLIVFQIKMIVNSAYRCGSLGYGLERNDFYDMKSFQQEYDDYIQILKNHVLDLLNTVK